jgi:hypothetical protein
MFHIIRRYNPLPMLRPLPFLAIALLAVPAFGDNSTGTSLIPNNHGGYNVIEGNAPPPAIPFFGSHGFAAKVIAHSHDKKSFIIVPVVQDDGHGNKHTVYHKVYFATPEEAEAAKAKL